MDAKHQSDGADNAAVEPVKTPKWRLLEPNIDRVEVTDETFLEIGPSNWGWIEVPRPIVGQIYRDGWMAVRRRMTPAEEHAEETLAGYKALLEWVNDPDADPNAWALMVYAAECDIAKAEGKPQPSIESKV